MRYFSTHEDPGTNPLELKGDYKYKRHGTVRVWLIAQLPYPPCHPSHTISMCLPHPGLSRSLAQRLCFLYFFIADSLSSFCSCKLDWSSCNTPSQFPVLSNPCCVLFSLSSYNLCTCFLCVSLLRCKLHRSETPKYPIHCRLLSAQGILERPAIYLWNDHWTLLPKLMEIRAMVNMWQCFSIHI